MYNGGIDFDKEKTASLVRGCRRMARQQKMYLYWKYRRREGIIRP